MYRKVGIVSNPQLEDMEKGEISSANMLFINIQG